MGEEVGRATFNSDDFQRFDQALRRETARLAEHFADPDGFSPRGPVAGFELEAWLTSHDGAPLAINKPFLERLDNPLVVPELAAFNVELNGSPSALQGRVFSRLHDELAATMQACEECAASMDCAVLTIGILPAIAARQLTSVQMSEMARYRALNDQVLKLRGGALPELAIDGDNPLQMQHPDVMLEAAATSFQLHVQVPPDRAGRAMNAALALSAATVGASANSPFLFGHSLWQETRIPLFEQAVSTGPDHPQRVGFGPGYVRHSLLEWFQDNLDRFPILIPAELSEDLEQFNHLRFHNGTIWHWNRPLVGFDYDGQLHLRIEHRVIPAGPTLLDSIANAALFYGLLQALSEMDDAIEASLPFARARDNFYAAARYGLAAQVRWPAADLGRAGRGRTLTRGLAELSLRELLLERLLPLAADGLRMVRVPEVEIEHYLGVLVDRVESGQTGADWQQRWVAANGHDMAGLTRAYLERQRQGDPVHSWTL